MEKIGKHYKKTTKKQAVCTTVNRKFCWWFSGHYWKAKNIWKPEEHTTSHKDLYFNIDSYLNTKDPSECFSFCVTFILCSDF